MGDASSDQHEAVHRRLRHQDDGMSCGADGDGKESGFMPVWLLLKTSCVALRALWLLLPVCLSVYLVHLLL